MPLFWDRIDPYIPDPLEAAVERAYEVFAKYTISGTIVHCDCPVCMTEEVAQQLSTLPLKEISSGLLGEYTNSAHGYDDGDIEREFKHFLPRYLELIAECRPPSSLDLGPCLDRLGQAGYRNRWPAHEVAAVDAFFIEFLKASVYQLGLLEWPAGLRLEYDLGEVLVMIVRAGGDLDAALAAFDASPDPEVAVHMASMRHDVRIEDGRVHYHDAFLKEHPDAADAIGLFLVRDSVDERITAAPALLDDPDFDEVLELGMGMTKH